MKGMRMYKGRDGMANPDRIIRHVLGGSISADGIVVEETMQAGQYRLRRCSPVEILLKRGSISRSQYEAAHQLYHDYALGVVGADDREKGELPPGIQWAGGDPYPVVRLAAITRFRQAVRSLGLRLSAVVLPVVCEEMYVKKLAERREERQEGTMAILRLGLDSLADHYGSG
ncbi:MAG: hypothetical protein FD149_1678 [Rhodospirillaceae bacterium]|nr:MAG: hypothetical protein FD149_1678 [Rhodospirillaceae bacterium]